VELTSSSQTEFGPIRHVLLKRPREAFVTDEAIDRQWRQLHYMKRPDLERASAEHDGFAALLEGLGLRTDFLPGNPTAGLDSVYTRDASVVCGKGIILCGMGKPPRRGEPAAQEASFRDLGLPVLGRIQGKGTLEGGDVAWIDERTLAVGRGYRTNDEGIEQLRQHLDGSVDELIVVPLPHWRGPDDCFHLMSFLSPVDRDLAVVYSPLLPVPFREALVARGFELVEVPDEEFETMGCNVLAVAPRKCVVLAGNPETRARLERAGAEVHEYAGQDISLKGGGGPTCLTRPTLRG
jgi:N-dimethylarginine dimethylaminohydrolase